MNLERLFRPRSIAVFGGGPAEQVVLQCGKMGYSGAIWPVHPTRDAVLGRRCFRSVDELPGAPDAAFVGINRNLTIGIVRQLAERGAGGAICYASGFAEAEDGESLNDALLDAAGPMPIIGPNCYGVINYLDGALLWPDQHGGTRVPSGVAIVTQSSNIALNMTMQRRGLPIAYVATAGNQAQIGLSDIARSFLDDSRVSAIGLHVEGIDDVRRFEAMATHARNLGKPVVAITIGRSEQARAATISHTASIAGSAAGTAAFFHRLAIPRLRSIPEFLETLKLLHVYGPLPGADCLSMSCSGGEASVMADAAIGRAVRFRPFQPEEQARVKATLSDMVMVANPLDYHTFIWAKEAAMTETFAAAIGCGFDLSMLVLDFPRTDRCGDRDWDVAVRAIKSAAARSGGRTAVVASLAENMPESRADELMAAGIVPLCGIDEALAAVEAAAFVGQRWREPALHRLGEGQSQSASEVISSPRRGEAESRSDRVRVGSADTDAPTLTRFRASLGLGLSRPGRGTRQANAVSAVQSEKLGGSHSSAGASLRTLSEAEAKAALAAFAVPVPPGRVVSSPDEAVAAGDELGYPVALKALGIAHKSEAGAVRLNLHRGALHEAAATLADLGSGLLVERMVTDAVAELLVGVTRDRQFGLLLTIATGGVLVELLRDSVSLLLPVTESEIRTAILSLKTAPLLQGFRGRPVADLPAAVAAIAAVARYAESEATALDEVEVNPLLVRPEGKGAMAVDALIRMRDA